MMTGAGIFLVSLNPRLGIAALLPALGVLIVTQLISPWVKTKEREESAVGRKHERGNPGKPEQLQSDRRLQSHGLLSKQIQRSQ